MRTRAINRQPAHIALHVELVDGLRNLPGENDSGDERAGPNYQER